MGINHELKIDPLYFEAVLSGSKTFEIRKNDRNFQTGDTVLLREYGEYYYTGRKYIAEIGYISSYEQKQGYIVFSLLNLVKTV